MKEEGKTHLLILGSLVSELDVNVTSQSSFSAHTVFLYIIHTTVTHDILEPNEFTKQSNRSEMWNHNSRRV